MIAVCWILVAFLLFAVFAVRYGSMNIIEREICDFPANIFACIFWPIVFSFLGFVCLGVYLSKLGNK